MLTCYILVLKTVIFFKIDLQYYFKTEWWFFWEFDYLMAIEQETRQNHPSPLRPYLKMYVCSIYEFGLMIKKVWCKMDIMEMAIPLQKVPELNHTLPNSKEKV